MADGAPYPPTGRKLATDEVTYSGEPMDLPLGRLVKSTGDEGSKTVVEYNPSTEDKQDATITAVDAVTTALGAQATAAKQDTAQTALDAIKTAVEGTLDVDTGLNLSGLATGAKQDIAKAVLDAIAASVAAAATEATLAAISAQLPAALSSGRLMVELDAAALSALETITVASITAAIPAGSNTIGAVDLTAAALAALETIQIGSIAAGDNNIGNVDVVTLPALPAGSNAIGQVTANAGTNLNTSALALETGGNLAAIAASVSSIDGGTPAALGQTTMSASQPVVIASNQSAVPISGDVASGASDTGNPLSVGLRAATTNPTAVSDGQRVKAMGDDLGRQVVVLNQVRDLVGRQTTTLSNTTSETTIVTAVASTYCDLTGLTMTNGGVTLTRVDIRDDTAGTVQFSVWLAPNGGGAVLTFPVPLAQTATNKNWTAQCSAATTDVRVLATFVKNV